MPSTAATAPASAQKPTKCQALAGARPSQSSSGELSTIAAPAATRATARAAGWTEPPLRGGDATTVAAASGAIGLRALGGGARSMVDSLPLLGLGLPVGNNS